MAKGAIYFGMILILFGIFLLFIAKFHIVAIIYGSIAIIIGLALIIFHNLEDKIEQRKDINIKKNKK